MMRMTVLILAGLLFFSCNGSGGISACSYNFGDDSAPVEVSADAQGNCEPATHTYTEAGGYNVVLAVWDEPGMVGQDSATIQAGPQTGASDRSGTFIDGCLEAYWWTPDQGGPFPAMVHYTPYRGGSFSQATSRAAPRPTPPPSTTSSSG